jgi:hypothetical protein
MKKMTMLSLVCSAAVLLGTPFSIAEGNHSADQVQAPPSQPESAMPAFLANLDPSERGIVLDDEQLAATKGTFFVFATIPGGHISWPNISDLMSFQKYFPYNTKGYQVSTSTSNPRSLNTSTYYSKVRSSKSRKYSKSKNSRSSRFSKSRSSRRYSKSNNKRSSRYSKSRSSRRYSKSNNKRSSRYSKARSSRYSKARSSRRYSKARSSRRYSSKSPRRSSRSR